MTVKMPMIAEVAQGIWIAQVEPADLLAFGTAYSQIGVRSVLLVPNASVSADGRYVELPLRDCRLANQGSSAEVVVVEVSRHSRNGAMQEASAESADPSQSAGVDICSQSASEKQPFTGVVVDTQVSGTAGASPYRPGVLTSPTSGDDEFRKDLERLPTPIRNIGMSILQGVREVYPHGCLNYRPKCGRYIERPDNFWTIKPQPRAESFAITVRGTFDSSKFSLIEVKPDRGSYSRFVVRDQNQVEEAIRVILSARRRW